MDKQLVKDFKMNSKYEVNKQDSTQSGEKDESEFLTF